MDRVEDESPFPPSEIPEEPEYLRELDEIVAKELCLTVRQRDQPNCGDT